MSINNFRLDRRLALVTGSSAGIGKALAQGLAQAGATVVLNGRDPARLEQARAQLSGEGLSVHARSFDVTDAAASQAAVDAIEKEIGSIDILINNAGIQRRFAFPEFPHAQWREVINTNLDSVFYVGQAVARHMIARQRGRIINICSILSELARPGIIAYTASKGALKMLTKGITVNGIGPGYIKTELTQALVDDPTFSTWLIGRTPARRWGEVQDLTGAAVFLASDAASFVNGHILYVDGGLTASM
jgi:gluconate 5-dehydrogenase